MKKKSTRIKNVLLASMMSSAVLLAPLSKGHTQSLVDSSLLTSLISVVSINALKDLQAKVNLNLNAQQADELLLDVASLYAALQVEAPELANASDMQRAIILGRVVNKVFEAVAAALNGEELPDIDALLDELVKALLPKVKLHIPQGMNILSFPVDNLSGNDIRDFLKDLGEEREINIIRFDNTTGSWTTFVLYAPGIGWYADREEDFKFRPGEAFALDLFGPTIDVEVEGLGIPFDFSQLSTGHLNLIGASNEQAGPVRNLNIQFAAGNIIYKWQPFSSTGRWIRHKFGADGLWRLDNGSVQEPVMAPGEGFFINR